MAKALLRQRDLCREERFVLSLAADNVGGEPMHQHHARSESDEIRVDAASCSDTGRMRTQNEDAVALCEPPDQERLARLGRLYLLADGAGGHAAGEVASRLAVETIASRSEEHTS